MRARGSDLDWHANNANRPIKRLSAPIRALAHTGYWPIGVLGLKKKEAKDANRSKRHASAIGTLGAHQAGSGRIVRLPAHSQRRQSAHDIA